MDLLAAMATFVRVADAGSLSKASRTLKVTPAAVSRQLSTLEDELGATLIVRTTRRLALTDEGRRFYDHAERTLHEAAEARAAVRGDHAVTGRVTLSMPTALAVTGIHLALAALVADNPGLLVDVRLEDHPVDLLADGIDVAIRAGLVPPDSTILVAHALQTMERAVVAAPAYLRRRGEPRTPAELAAHDAVIHLHAGTGVGVWQLHAGEPPRRGRAAADPGRDDPVSITVTGPVRATALHVLRDMAVAGAGIALLPRFVVADDLRRARLRELPLGGWRPRTQQIYALVRVEARSRARVRAVVDHVRAHLASL